MARKQRSDYHLKFTPEQKATLLGWLDGGTSCEEAARLVYSEFDIKTNRDTISKWYKPYLIVGDLREAAVLAQTLREELESLPIALDDELISQVTQAKFEREVAERGDLEGHVALRKLRQKDQDQKLAERTLSASTEGFRLRYEQKERELALAEAKFDNAKFKVAEQTKKLREKGASITDEERLEIVRVVDQAMGIS